LVGSTELLTSTRSGSFCLVYEVLRLIAERLRSFSQVGDFFEFLSPVTAARLWRREGLHTCSHVLIGVTSLDTWHLRLL
jgi:hypothetical protein